MTASRKDLEKLHALLCKVFGKWLTDFLADPENYNLTPAHVAQISKFLTDNDIRAKSEQNTDAQELLAATLRATMEAETTKDPRVQEFLTGLRSNALRQDAKH